MSDFSFYLAQIIDGIAYGSIYGIFALSIVLIFRATKLFNLAQTEIATFSAVIMILMMRKFPFPVAFALTLVASFGMGVALHACVMRIVTERRKVLNSNTSAITIGFFSIFNSLSSYLLGDETQTLPSPFGVEAFNVLGVGISRHSIGILVVTALLVGAIYLFFRFTRMGLAFEAVSENIIGAKIRGIHASRTLAVAWGVTCMTAAVGAILIAPILYVTPAMLSGIFAYSLIAVVIGGLESPLGALVGGILVGIVENLASNIPAVGSELKFVVVVAFLILVLMIRPRGIWGRAEGRRV